jgi:hypothetical protein
MPTMNGSAPAPGAETENTSVAKLKRQLAEANQKAAAAEEGRTAERRGRIAAESSRADSENARLLDNEVAVKNAIAAAEQLLGSLEADMEAAVQGADGKRQAAIMRNITTAQNRLDYARGQEAQIDALKRQGGVRPQPQVEPGEDPRLAHYPPATRAWIRRNPQFLSDDRFKARALGFHQLAIGDGLEIESPAYFKFIDAGMRGDREGKRERPRRDEGDDRGGAADDIRWDEGNNTDDLEESTGTAARPSSRSANSGARESTSYDEIVLDETLREGARISNPGLWDKDPQAAMKEYAQNRRELLREGRIGPRSRGQ